jgi:hypothetical protein
VIGSGCEKPAVPETVPVETTDLATFLKLTGDRVVNPEAEASLAPPFPSGYPRIMPNAKGINPQGVRFEDALMEHDAFQIVFRKNAFVMFNNQPLPHLRELSIVVPDLEHPVPQIEAVFGPEFQLPAEANNQKYQLIIPGRGSDPTDRTADVSRIPSESQEFVAQGPQRIFFRAASLNDSKTILIALRACVSHLTRGLA